MTVRIAILTLLIAVTGTSCSLHRPPREREVTLVTKPTFRKVSLDAVGSGNVEIYNLQTGEGGFERSIYWPDDAPRPRTLSKNRNYCIDLLEEEHRFPGGKSVWTPDLVRVKDGDRVIYDASVCRIHKTTMTRETVRISYGYPGFDHDYLRQSGKFPNTGLVLGGCSLSEIESKSTRAWICPDCLAAQKRWKDQHPISAWSVPKDSRMNRRPASP